MPASVLRVLHMPDQPGSVPAAPSGADLVTSSDLELQRLLASTELDHAFYMQSPAGEGKSVGADSQQLWQRSMAWAIRAHTRAGQTCRASVVMPASLGPADAGALGLARTLFMEQRALCGPALFLDTTGPPMSQQVKTTHCCSQASQGPYISFAWIESCHR